MLREVSRPSALPDVEPIQPVLTKPFHRDGWVYEEKYDGGRMLAYKDGRHVRLVSRRGWTTRSGSPTSRPPSVAFRPRP
jgi:ATP-dependent DNA ligase